MNALSRLIITLAKSQGLLKGEVKAEELVDTRYATTTAAK